jgi:hypothetical protein
MQRGYVLFAPIEVVGDTQPIINIGLTEHKGGNLPVAAPFV